MYYIIDANNLAGKLHLLREKNFDKKLIATIKKYNAEKNKKIILVFDGTDPMGDKISDGRLTVIYTPKDNYYKSADDKIIELAKNYVGAERTKPDKHEDIAVITDDLEIRRTMKKLVEETGKQIHMQSATSFAKKLEKVINNDKDGVVSDNKEGLSDNEVKRINEEMLRIWQ